jgi:hypothetical protein
LTVSTEFPDRYDAAVTLAECQLARGRVARDVDWLNRALATLERASGLEGCGNRVAYLQASARLSRAQLTIAAGENLSGAQADLASVIAHGENAAARVPDNHAWLELIAEARRLSGS